LFIIFRVDLHRLASSLTSNSFFAYTASFPLVPVERSGRLPADIDPADLLTEARNLVVSQAEIVCDEYLPASVASSGLAGNPSQRQNADLLSASGDSGPGKRPSSCDPSSQP
jgi:hypothetical protein